MDRGRDARTGRVLPRRRRHRSGRRRSRRARHDVRLAPQVAVSGSFLDALASACGDVERAPDALVEIARDWWPLGLRWMYDGEVVAQPAAIARARTVEEIAAVVRLC